MKSFISLGIFILGLFSGSRAFAGLGAQLTGFYLSDSFSQPATTTQSKYVYSAELLYSFDKFKFAYFGVQLVGVNQTDASSASTTVYSAQDYGPMFSVEIDKAHQWVIAGAYNLQASATYDATGAATKLWTGNSYWLRFGHQHEIGKGFYIGGHLLYYNASYTSQQQSSTTQGISYTRSSILPVLSLSYWH